MTSPAIPARLQFLCGHAALVTLPRIKGETAAQRNERVAREKSAALARQCDFCAPAIAVAVNSSTHALAAALAEPGPVVVQAEPELLVLVEAEPTTFATESSQLQEATELTEVTIIEEEPAAEETVPEVLVVATGEETPSSDVAGAADTETESPIHGNAARSARALRRRATGTARKTRAEEVARGRQFLVEYRVERVLHAVDIHDALRQAANFGAGELTAITRED